MSERSGLRVRPATEDDLPEVCKIINHYIENSFVNFRTELQAVDEWRNVWGRLHSQFPWLVATDDRVVGVAYAAPWNDRAAYQWTAEATVYVDPSRQRRGIAAREACQLLHVVSHEERTTGKLGDLLVYVCEDAVRQREESITT